MVLGTEQLPGGVEPQFVVDVSATGAAYRSGGVMASLSEITGAMRTAATHASALKIVVAGSVIAAWFAVAAVGPWLAVVTVIASIVLLARAAEQDRRLRRVALLYRLDDRAAQAHDGVSNGVGWLASSRALWRITHEEPLQRPANTTSVTRAPAKAAHTQAENILTNVAVPSISAAGETFLFLPDALLIRDRAGNCTDIPYAFIRVELDTTRFSESGQVPPDSAHVGVAWLYANKDGSPDRRRTGNIQIPVLEYARITLSWKRSGCVLLASNVTAARHFANGLQARTQLSQPRWETPRPVSAAPTLPAATPLPVTPVRVTPVAPALAAPVTLPPPPASPTIAPPPVALPPTMPQITPAVAPTPVSALVPPPATRALTTPAVTPMITPPIAPPADVPAAAPEPRTALERALLASIERKRREEAERQNAAVAAQVHAAVTARASVPAIAGAEWLGEGRSVNIDGYTTGDFVHVGSKLPALDGSGVEPSLINPALPVDVAHPNTSGAGMNYWPSYSSISAASRAAFLQWLAGRRRDPHAYIGYVFIFFYGLERRVYEFIQRRGSSADEVLSIAREVARLLDLYGAKSGSFASYAASLLDLLAVIDPRARSLAVDIERRDYGPAQRLKILLGELSLAGQPIPAAQALEWLRSSYALNTAATRCATEFELLFHIRYTKKFGAGMVIKPNKTYVDLTYRPASSALDIITLKDKRIPDVTLLARPLAKLIELAQECSTALDPFSRYLGKIPEGRESLAAFALLPEELVEATPSADATALASLVRAKLDEGGRAHLETSELLRYVRLSKPEKVSKNEAMLLAQALEKLGYGIEPDVRLGGPVYEVGGRVVVFRRLPDCPSIASEEYAVATLLIRLGAMVSAADDAVSQAERELLERHIEQRLRLTPGERQRLTAHLVWLLDAGLGTSGLKRRLEALPGDARHAVGQLLVDVAASDGHIDAREMKVLEKLYDLLDLPSGDLYRDVHAAQAQSDEPVAVEATPAPKGFAIPARPAPATTASGIDMERVRLKIAETRQVSTLLSSIFVEDDAPVTVAPAIAQANTIGTLDAAHSELLRRLAERESWPRDEVERLAGELALLTDGALENLNDYAYATADEPLWEDDDPVAINSKVAMELMS